MVNGWDLVEPWHAMASQDKYKLEPHADEGQCAFPDRILVNVRCKM